MGGSKCGATAEGRRGIRRTVMRAKGRLLINVSITPCRFWQLTLGGLQSSNFTYKLYLSRGRKKNLYTMVWVHLYGVARDQLVEARF